ncbi:hypothetical protein [Stenotrophomonas rhizophila]|uniref:hypothetical protein n=1 Tax=Stenotrophomonas rhizophila TaxID=216778 RepID=UPI0011CD7DB4|nr:hypothetical protein [Stenotrophomonas rhizophila]
MFDEVVYLTVDRSSTAIAATLDRCFKIEPSKSKAFAEGLLGGRGYGLNRYAVLMQRRDLAMSLGRASAVPKGQRG